MGICMIPISPSKARSKISTLSWEISLSWTATDGITSY